MGQNPFKKTTLNDHLEELVNYENEVNHKMVSSVIALYAAVYHLFATTIIKISFAFIKIIS